MASWIGRINRQVLPASDNDSIIEDYWQERHRFMEELRGIPEMRSRHRRAIIIYLARRLLWAFAFFPVFLVFWVNLVLFKFNLVALTTSLLPLMQGYVDSSLQQQATTLNTVVIAWFSIGLTYAIFDFVLTPYHSPYEQEAEIHMRVWEQLQAAQHGAGASKPDRQA